VGDENRIIEPRKYFALSPGRGAMPGIVAAVPERIQERPVSGGERASGRATLGPGRDNPVAEVSGEIGGDVAGDVGGDVAGNVGGDVAGNVGGDVAGDVGREVDGDVAGDVAGEVAAEVIGEAAAGDGRGPVEAGAVVAGAGDEGASVAVPNGGRCAVVATMR
jgi:hypothetical protein